MGGSRKTSISDSAFHADAKDLTCTFYGPDHSKAAEIKIRIS